MIISQSYKRQNGYLLLACDVNSFSEDWARICRSLWTAEALADNSFWEADVVDSLKGDVVTVVVGDLAEGDDGWSGVGESGGDLFLDAKLEVANWLEGNVVCGDLLEAKQGGWAGRGGGCFFNGSLKRTFSRKSRTILVKTKIDIYTFYIF